MRKHFIIVLTTLLLTACVTPGRPNPHGGATTCTGPGHTQINIIYGASELKVQPPISQVRRKATLRFNLNAGPGYENAKVTIAGKTEQGNWINVSGTEAL